MGSRPVSTARRTGQPQANRVRHRRRRAPSSWCGWRLRGCWVVGPRSVCERAGGGDDHDRDEPVEEAERRYGLTGTEYGLEDAERGKHP
jgi:hypothetical protein